MADTAAESGQAGLRDQPSVTAYAAPMVVFGALTAVEPFVPAGGYPIYYVAKIAVVSAVLAYFRRPLGDIRLSWAGVPLAAAAGLVIVAQWVLIDRLVSYPHLGTRVGYDPFAGIDETGLRRLFLVARLYGLVLVVPVMEELFWRSFLLRYVTKADFTTVPLGQFSAFAFWVVVALSAAAHTEWLVAALASAIFAWLLRRTRSLFAVVVAHAVANAALGGYILATGKWQYW
jgi:CAAX prenyl protease-like protein